MIEMMVAVAILGIAAGLAWVNILEWLPKYRLKTATREMISLMRQVKMEAATQNRSMQIVFDASSSPGFYFLDTDTDGTPDPGEKRINFADYSSGVGFGSGNAITNWGGGTINSSVTFNFGGTTLVRFTSRGMASTSGTVFIDNINNDVCYAITVLTTGSINLREWTGNTWLD